MTRKEEIQEMAKTTASHITSDKDMQVAFADALRRGAQWADRTLLDKVCDWLRVELDKEEELHYIHVHGFDKKRREIFLEDFRKAMKGE